MNDDATVARHGWAALLALLRSKGLITETEAQAVITAAHEGSARALALLNLPEVEG